MATLTNTQISVTYVGLLKTSANTVLSSTAQQITDGSGNNSILFLSTAGVGIGGAAASGKELDVTGNVLITGDLIVDNIKIDGNTISAESGVVTLSNGAIATTQSQNDNSTKIATTAYVDTAIDGVDTLAEILAIGNTTGATKISVNNTSSGIDFIDDAKARFGTGNDAEIYGNSDNLYIDQNTADKDILLRSDDGSDGIATYVFLDGSTGAVELNHYGTKKFETTSSGVSVTGGASFTDSITLNGNIKKLQWIDTNGNWKIEAGNGSNKLVIHSESLVEDYVTIKGGGVVQLNDYGSGNNTGTVAKNLAVDSSGNIIETDGGVVDGSGTANDVAMWSDSNTLTDAPIAISGNDATFAGDITATSKKFISTSSSSGDYVRLYAGSGTAQWDIYGSGENLRLSENSSGGGIFQVDSGATFGGTINDLTLSSGSIATNTSNNFALNTPNSLRINIDSNNSATDQIFAIGHNQTAVDNSNNVLFSLLENGLATFAGDVTLDNSGSGDRTLTISTTTGGDPMIVMNSDASNRSGIIRYQDNGTNIGRIEYVHNGDKLQFQAGSATGQILELTNSLATFAGNVTATGTSITLDSAGSADYIADRINTSSGAAYQYKTNGTLKWYTGLRGLANDDFYLFNNTASVNALIITESGSNATFAGSVAVAGSNAPEKKLSINSAQSNGIQFNYDNTNNYRNQILNYWNSAPDTRMDFNIARTSGQTPETIMSVGYNSNVGIGTTSPSGKLNVEAPGNHLHLRAGTAAAGKYWNFDVTANNQLFIITDGNNGMNITNTGNVGIGTTSPSYKLDVESDTDSVAGAYIQAGKSSQGEIQNTGLIVGSRTDISTGDYLGISFSGNSSVPARGRAAIGVISTSGASAMDLVFMTRNAGDGSQLGSSDEKMRIHSDGNVTIGNTASVQPLTVGGNVLFRTTTADSFENRFQFIVGGSGDAGNFYVYDAAESAKIRLNGNGDSYFNGGNVGISNTSPSSKIHIGSNSTSGAVDIGLQNDSRHYTIKTDGGNLKIKDESAASDRIVLDSSGQIKTQNRNFAKESNFGYSSGYKALVLGSTGTNISTNSTTVSINYDPSGNAYSGFNGDGREVLFRRGVQFVTPNSADNSMYLYNLVLKDGQAGINTTPFETALHIKQIDAAQATLKVEARSDTSVNNILSFTTKTGSTSWYHFVGQAGSGLNNKIIIYGNGNVENTNNSYGQVSDENLKENIVDATPKLEDIKKLKVKNFNFKGDDYKQIGMIAQDVEKIFPSLVEEVTDPETKEKRKSLKYSVFVPMLIKSIQELEKRVQELESK